jgi:curved DNA-binding protein CbpA
MTALRESADAWEAADARIEQTFAGERQRIDSEERDARQAEDRATALPPEPPAELANAVRARYRKLARLFHPDVAATAEERSFNESAMRRINVAMERHDLQALETLELQLPSREFDLPGPTSGARIAWATEEVARLEEASARLNGDLVAERASSLHTLWERVERDPGLLDRLETSLTRELTTREMELHALRRDYDRLLGERMTDGLLPSSAPAVPSVQ